MWFAYTRILECILFRVLLLLTRQHSKNKGLNVEPYYPELFCNNPKQKNIYKYVYVCIHVSILFGAIFFYI
jgi:hypothetical protein